MAKTFGNLLGGTREPYNIAGPQFDMDPQRVKLIHGTLPAAATNITVYTVPPGKVLYISKLIIMNAANTATTWQTLLKDALIYIGDPGARTTTEQNFATPAILTAGHTIKVVKQSQAVDAYLGIIGWEI